MIPVKILGKEYRLKADADPEHIEQVAEYVDRMLHEVGGNHPDTLDTAVLTALNIASEFLRIRDGGCTVEGARIQALIDLVDSV